MNSAAFPSTTEPAPALLQAPALRRLARIAPTLYFELSLGIGVGLVGTVLAARVSDTATAAFVLANHVASMLFILFRVVGASG